MRTRLFPKKIVCSCGWWNNEPTKQREPFARCKRCGKLIDRKYYCIEQVLKIMKKNKERESEINENITRTKK